MALDSPSAITALQTAIARLEWLSTVLATRNAAAAEPDRKSTSLLIAWPLSLTEDYVSMLRQDQPHALVILAYYCALLDERRKSWMLGEAPRFLVYAISGHLGDTWAGLVEPVLQLIAR
ncbi:uncharacterized protein HMPREF1541_03508 [Cyphellophora europaea CBS 101466]|uniref:Uncharacterized protein n=1 Tax=Cyphellophora europaea (strain CBS 101466) TaxID=1220924 RepID=W2RYP9_CYPE1|nr:uncharacterized protein HMPREF1541_03508 [Cyphellophora europaea CBS 101466]ETN41572.1 hypothetical protein HMPREF1541_03508 [Cyphellophora europaea CBS 101466]